MLFLFCLLLGFGDVYLGEFMEIGVGARALGMGNAFVALADDPTAFYWNPAGLVRVKNRELFLMHSEDFEAGIVQTNTVAITYPAPSYTLGVALYWVGVPEIGITDSSEAGININEYVDVCDYVGYFSYAREFTKFKLGLNIKCIFRDWDIATAYGVGTDLGILSDFKGVTYGVNIVNLTGTEIFGSDTTLRDWISPLIKTGISAVHNFTVGKLNICLGFDTSPEKRVAEIVPLHTDTYIGFEYWWKQRLAVRLGWDKGIFSAGCGIVHRTIKLDYGVKFHPDLGLVKRISGSIIF
ncbi:MAG: UPF0164 family protein [bacterium]|nr:UPF0164 family protein [bacterium]